VKPFLVSGGTAAGTAAILVVALSLAGCSPDGGGGTPAFPDRRSQFPPNGRTLGYVANQMSDTVSVLDLDGMIELGQGPVGRSPVDVDGPRHIQIDTAAGVGYVVLSYPLSMPSAHAALDGVMAPFGYVQALTLLDLAPVGDVRVDRWAAGMALSDDKATVAVVAFDQQASVLGTDLDGRRANLTVVPAAGLQKSAATERTLRLCVAPIDVAFGKDQHRARAYVACTGEDSLAVVDIDDMTVLARVPAGADATNKPVSIAVDPTGGHVLLSNQISARVATFTATDTPQLVISSDELPGQPNTVTFVSDTQYVVPLQNPNGIARVDAATGAVLAQSSYTDDQCQNPQAASQTPDGRLYLVCEGDHYSPGAVVRLDPTSLEIQAKVMVGLYPDRLAIRTP
jgi:DNA-binding beta-propeller fold protein YncE